MQNEEEEVFIVFHVLICLIVLFCGGLVEIRMDFRATGRCVEPMFWFWTGTRLAVAYQNEVGV